jgi:hypothetical protein
VVNRTKKMPYLNIYTVARSAFLAAALLKIQVFWDVMLCRLVNIFRRFGESYFLPLQAKIFLVTLTEPEAETRLPIETCGVSCPLTWGNVAEGLNIGLSDLYDPRSVYSNLYISKGVKQSHYRPVDAQSVPGS